MLNRKVLKKDKIKCAIVGAGKMAAGFDNPKSREILTHAHVYTVNSKTNLVGFFDKNKKVGERAAKKWHTSSFNSLKEMCLATHPDIISICTPDSTHARNLTEALKYKPKLIICEKPVTESLKDTKKIMDLCAKSHIPIIVNYSYRYDLCIQNIRKRFKAGRYGKVLCARGIYTKGILHNGSHIIDLARYLFGEIKNTQTNYRFPDYDKKDQNISGFIRFKKCPQFYLTAANEQKYSIFELDILFERKRIVITDNGFIKITYNIIKDGRYRGYKVLGPPEVTQTELPHALSCLVKTAVDYIERRGKLVSDIVSAYQTQKACSNLLTKRS